MTNFSKCFAAVAAMLVLGGAATAQGFSEAGVSAADHVEVVDRSIQEAGSDRPYELDDSRDFRHANPGPYYDGPGFGQPGGVAPEVNEELQTRLAVACEDAGGDYVRLGVCYDAEGNAIHM